MTRAPLAFRTLTAARRLACALRVDGPLRSSVGPWVGRAVYRLFGAGNRVHFVHGHRLRLADGPAYPPLEMVTGTWELSTVRLMERLLHPGDTVVDCGAHVGYFTLLAARAVGPTGRVYAFEPEPANHALLCENLRRNGYEHVRVYRQAVAGQRGSAELISSGLDNGQHTLVRTGRPERHRQTVETITLDTVLEANGWPPVALVKLDLEGGEPDALRGMERLLARPQPPRLILEFCPQILRAAGVRPCAVLEDVAARGFNLFLYGEHTAEEPLTPEVYAGLIARLERLRGYKNLLCVPASAGRTVEPVA